MFQIIIGAFRNMWTGKPFGTPNRMVTRNFHVVPLEVRTAEVSSSDALSIEVQQPLFVCLTPQLPEADRWAHGEHYVLEQGTGEAWLARDIMPDYEPESFEYGNVWSAPMVFGEYYKPKPDDVPPLDAQKSNGFPSPYPTPFIYEQKQPKFGSRVLLFDEEDNEWLCVQLASVNNKITWTVDNYHCWIIEPKPTDRWLPFPPAPIN